MLANYAGYSPAVKRRAVQLLFARPTWAMALLKAVDAGKFPKSDISVDNARAAVALGDKEVTALVEKHFGKLTPATAGEKQARIAWLNTALGREKGDAARGKVLFIKHCAACHQLHGEGGKVGPGPHDRGPQEPRVYARADRRSFGLHPPGIRRPERIND